MVRIFLLILFVSCSSSKDPKGEPGTNPGSAPSGTAAAPATAAVDDSPRGLCTRGCQKLIICAGAAGGELGPCIDTCAAGSPQKAQIEQIERMTCEQIVAGGVPAGVATPAAGGTGCTADCRGCAGDNTSCYAIAGGSHGIPCDPCCCAPGGPSPSWRTEE